MAITEYASNKIRVLSLMASFMVVMLHVFLREPHTTGEMLYKIVFHDGLCSFAVPFFFVVSGFFFMNRYEPSVVWWSCGVKKRIGSLIVPYFFWCGIVLLEACLLSNSKVDILHGFGITTITPANPPMWYVKVLFVMALAFPPLKWIADRTYLLLVVIVALIMALAFQIPGIITLGRAMIYFLLGLRIATDIDNWRWNADMAKKLFVFYMSIWVVYVMACVLVYVFTGYYWRRLWLYAPLVNMPMVWLGYDVAYKMSWFRKLVSNMFFLSLCKTSFFIYCSHYNYLLVFKGHQISYRAAC